MVDDDDARETLQCRVAELGVEQKEPSQMLSNPKDEPLSIRKCPKAFVLCGAQSARPSAHWRRAFHNAPMKMPRGVRVLVIGPVRRTQQLHTY